MAPVRLSEKAYRRLKTMILTGRFADRVLSERDLAAKLGFSRVPVREAIQELQREGFVTVVPRSGIVLRQLGIDEVRDLYELRQAIEGMAAFLCAARAPLDERRAMRTRLEAVAAGPGPFDHALIQSESVAFHRALFRLCGNAELAVLYGTIEPKIALNLRLTAAHALAHVESALFAHIEIAKAIEAGDGAIAERLMRDHLESGKNTRIDILSKWEASSADQAAARPSRQPARRANAARRQRRPQTGRHTNSKSVGS